MEMQEFGKEEIFTSYFRFTVKELNFSKDYVKIFFKDGLMKINILHISTHKFKFVKEGENLKIYF